MDYKVKHDVIAVRIKILMEYYKDYLKEYGEYRKAIEKLNNYPDPPKTFDEWAGDFVTKMKELEEKK